MYTDSVWQLTGKAFLVFGVVAFLIQWLLPRWKKYKQHYHQKVEKPNEDISVKKRKQIEAREKLQEQHDIKAVIFNEKILVPREEAKKKKKEKEFERFSGPAWKGEGHELGGDLYLENTDSDEQTLSLTAARRRKLPESESKVIPQSTVKQKVKKVITLPEEPAEGSTDSVTVILRTPVGRMFKRKFYHYNQFQAVLDYMTTVGFSQSLYTISTSYPRRNLSEDNDKTLLELGFKTQVTLNVEEKDE